MTEEVKAACIVLGALAAFGLLYWGSMVWLVKAAQADADDDGVLEEMRARLGVDEELGGPSAEPKDTPLYAEHKLRLAAGIPPKPQTSKAAPRRKPSKKAKPRKKA